jgi:hypothetical protein
VIDENDLTACSADGFEAEGFDLSKAKKRKTLQDVISTAGFTPLYGINLMSIVFTTADA